MKKLSSFSELINYISSDVFRYIGTKSKLKAIKNYIRTPQLRYIVFYRIGSYCIGRKWMFPIKLYVYLRLFMLRSQTGIQIPIDTKIGKGLFIGHHGSIVINHYVEIGENVNIIQTTTIGVTYRGSKAGCPKIGNGVYIGAGSRIVGKITIGDNSMIAPNAVVIDDVPSNVVVGGIPAKIISLKGSFDYVYNRV